MLLIDIGNTRLKWCRKAQLLQQPAQALIHQNDFVTAFGEILKREQQVCRVAIASVQKADVREQIFAACQQVFGVEPFMPLSSRQCGKLVNV
ncbi:MAG TPA: type III pantothenate kinase, partial [Pseudomonadales bacterium]|nr:type III pantothenate kinase [Pseudomonadales bacterium]